METNKYKSSSSAVAETTELVITRTFNAPRDIVWRYWTEPDYFKRWWGPKGFTTPNCDIDFRVGGKYLNCMRSPEGKDYWNTGVYKEIASQQKIVATDCFADEKGNIVPSTYYGMSKDFPLEMLLTVTFEDVQGKTKLTIRHTGIPAGKDYDDCREGWNQSLEKLADALK